MGDTVRILFIGDIVGEPGLKLIDTFLSTLKDKYNADFIIVNGENSMDGIGISAEICKRLFENGVHVITGGNHSFAKWKIFPYMKTEHRLLRPMNYPEGAHGYGYGVFDVPGTPHKIGVLNLMGRTYMQAIDDPFRIGDYFLQRIKEQTPIVFVDFHAEATAEKVAYAFYVDGKVSVIAGTHTHIPTSDARILPNGSGYITDVGMTGAYDSVIGMEKANAIRRFVHGTPYPFSTGDGDNRICGVFAEVDAISGKCKRIESVLFPEFNTQESI
jgi:metallophosphoesterase (TIGR00282 family)